MTQDEENMLGLTDTAGFEFVISQSLVASKRGYSRDIQATKALQLLYSMVSMKVQQHGETRASHTYQAPYANIAVFHLHLSYRHRRWRSPSQEHVMVKSAVFDRQCRRTDYKQDRTTKHNWRGYPPTHGQHHCPKRARVYR